MVPTNWPHIVCSIPELSKDTVLKVPYLPLSPFQGQDLALLILTPST